MKFVVVGGGNIGTVLASELRRINSEDTVFIETSDSTKWSSGIEVYDVNDNKIYDVSGINISDSCIDDGDVYFYTLPKQVIKDNLKKHLQRAKNKQATFVFFPGTGGVEYLLPKDTKFSFVGLQRVPYIARIKEYGKKVALLSKKEVVYYATIGNKCELDLERLIDVPCRELNNYLEVTLTPSNPILHTTRLYSMFHDKPVDYEYDKMIKFYEEWTDSASEYLIKCDEELQQIKNVLQKTDMSGLKSLKEHYESYNIKAMTEKIINIKAFKGIDSPMHKNCHGKYCIDLKSRYFLEDFDYGLLVIKAILQICGINCPTIDIVLHWYQSIVGKKIIDDDKVVVQEWMNIPQNARINTIEELENFYSK